MDKVKEIEEGEGRCGTCGKGEAVKIKGEDTGFVRCALKGRWEWLPGRLACAFNPVRHERRAE